MVNVDLTKDEYRIVRLYRKMKKQRNSKKNNNSNGNNFSYSLKNEINRQRKNLKKILSSKNLRNKRNKSYRRIVRTEKENGRFYKVTEEDRGNGLKEISRELLPNNLSDIYSDISESSVSSNYSRREYIKQKNGEGYRVVEEDKGDGKGFVKIFEEVI